MTLDYNIVLGGELVLMVDEGETIDKKHLKRFNDLVQSETKDLTAKFREDQANSRTA